MASTVEIFLAGLALVINTVIIIILYFVCNAFLGPFVHAMENVVTGANQVIPIGPFTWIFGFVFSLLLIFEIILVIAFIAVQNAGAPGMFHGVPTDPVKVSP